MRSSRRGNNGAMPSPLGRSSSEGLGYKDLGFRASGIWGLGFRVRV